jgi:hypothetical protein
VGLLVGDLHFGLDRVARKDRGREPDLVVAIGRDVRVQACGPEDQPRANAEGQVAMRDWLLERLRLAEFRVRMVGLPITGMHGMHHDIGLGNGPAGGHVGIADLEVFVEFVLVGHIFSLLIRIYSFLVAGRTPPRGGRPLLFGFRDAMDAGSPAARCHVGGRLR